MNNYRLTPAAKTDLMEIYHYSRQQWGERQADEYYSHLVGCFQKLSENRLFAKRRTDFPREIWSYLQGSHVVFFRPRNNSIEILRILHKSSDYQRHLQ